MTLRRGSRSISLPGGRVRRKPGSRLGGVPRLKRTDGHDLILRWSCEGVPPSVYRKSPLVRHSLNWLYEQHPLG